MDSGPARLARTGMPPAPRTLRPPGGNRFRPNTVGRACSRRSGKPQPDGGKQGAYHRRDEYLGVHSYRYIVGFVFFDGVVSRGHSIIPRQGLLGPAALELPAPDEAGGRADDADAGPVELLVPAAADVVRRRGAERDGPRG